MLHVTIPKQDWNWITLQYLASKDKYKRKSIDIENYRPEFLVIHKNKVKILIVIFKNK